MACVTVVGAGLAGCMSALLLSKHDPKLKIRVVEARSDVRIKETDEEQKAEQVSFEGNLANSAKRSINLALTYRGIQALKECNLWEAVKDGMIIEMKGRYVHKSNGSISVQPYYHGDSKEHRSWSISRAELNELLITELEKLKNVELCFGHKCVSVSKTGDVSVKLEDNKTRMLSSDFVLGADGVHSSVRSSMFRHGRYSFQSKYMSHGYKELTIEPSKKGEFKISGNYLHIWPRHDFMLIGLPNPDCSFTCTLFAPFEGEFGFESLDPKDKQNPTKEEIQRIRDYFLRFFSDIQSLIPDFIEQFIANPTSSLMQLSVKPWNYKGRICVLGDAAHALVPFYGQGMNCAFEDCLVLYELLEESDGKLEEVFSKFSSLRQPAAKALVDLSNQNYIEMRSLTAKTWFVIKKMFENRLNKWFPNLWIPIYQMVAFSRIPYHHAVRRAKFQDRILLAVILLMIVPLLIALKKKIKH